MKTIIWAVLILSMLFGCIVSATAANSWAYTSVELQKTSIHSSKSNFATVSLNDKMKKLVKDKIKKENEAKEKKKQAEGAKKTKEEETKK